MESETCVFTEDEVLVDKHEDVIRIITGNALNLCDPIENVCLLPDQVKLRKDKTCFSRLIKGTQISELVEVCQPFCFSNNNTVINQIEPEKCIITHAPESMYLKCLNNSQKINIGNHSNLESLEVEVPCFCSVGGNLKILISETLPCDAESIKKFKITHILPATWTKFESCKLNPMATHTHLTFDNLSECLNESRIALCQNSRVGP
ncbi:hypothetical protein JTB14_002211 [Gonioctena quinquepunctata]|nr:hypothetical protein JTB14_002211 [Gonioctena quinquepunctata]